MRRTDTMNVKKDGWKNSRDEGTTIEVDHVLMSFPKKLTRKPMIDLWRIWRTLLGRSKENRLNENRVKASPRRLTLIVNIPKNVFRNNRELFTPRFIRLQCKKFSYAYRRICIHELELFRPNFFSYFLQLTMYPYSETKFIHEAIATTSVSICHCSVNFDANEPWHCPLLSESFSSDTILCRYDFLLCRPLRSLTNVIF